MLTRLTTTSLILALAALPALAQATGGAGSATAGGTQSPGNADSGVTTDYATGKSSVTPASPATNAAPGLTPSQNRMGTLPSQNGGGNYERNGTRDTEPAGTSPQKDR